MREPIDMEADDRGWAELETVPADQTRADVVLTTAERAHGVYGYQVNASQVVFHHDDVERIIAARDAEHAAALEALRTALRQIESLAKVQAISCQAAHRADHARNWLDVLAIVERVPLDGGR